MPARSYFTLLGGLCCVLMGSGQLSANSWYLSIVAQGITNPSYGTPLPGEPEQLLICERSPAKLIKVDLREEEPVVSDVGGITRAIAWNGESGLLSVAAHPDYANNRKIYVAYTGSGQDLYVDEYTLFPTADVLTGLQRDVMRIELASSRNVGGWIGFGPDDLLYIAIGDGSQTGQDAHLAQDLTSPLGKLLRIDVDGDDFPDDRKKNYALPNRNWNAPSSQQQYQSRNPFNTNPLPAEGEPLPEILALGLHNPAGGHFDLQNGHLYIFDEPYNSGQEINLIPVHQLGSGGHNFGWPRYSKSSLYKSNIALGTASHTKPVSTTSIGGSAGGVILPGKQFPNQPDHLWVGDPTFTDLLSWDPQNPLAQPISRIGQLQSIEPGMSLVTMDGLIASSAGLFILDGNLSSGSGNLWKVSVNTKYWLDALFRDFRVTDLGNNVFEVAGFGFVATLPATAEYFYSYSHGYVYFPLSNAGSVTGLWYYDLAIGDWVYLFPDWYPHLYSTRQGWLWYHTHTSVPQRYFYRYSDNQEITEDALK